MTSSEVTSLYKLCMRGTIKLLQEHYWNPELPSDENPFNLLPSVVVDGLIDTVVGTDPDRPLRFSSDLRLLVRSGKVRDFRCFIELSSKGEEMLKEILMDLVSSCSSLRSITISTVYNSRHQKISAVREFNYLLRHARNIRHVDSHVLFDFRELHNSDKLETLILKFDIRDRMCDFFKVDGKFRPQTSLREFMVNELHRCSSSDVALILKYCTQLTSTNCDISRSLEQLHAEELHNGSLTHTYKLRKCRLGRKIFFDFLPASRDSVRIASLTCPLLQELRLYAEDNETVSALGDCLNLENITVIFNTDRPGDYTKGMQGLLEKPKIGHRLKALKIQSISNVDFSSIGMCCSNLERLKVCYSNGSVIFSGTFLPNLFDKLRYVKLEGDVSYIEGLTGLMCSAPNLERLEFWDYSKRNNQFTDDVLTGILSKNNLSNLKHFKGIFPLLSLEGWRNLARSLTALETVFVAIAYGHQCTVTSKEVLAVFSEVNPRVSVELRDVRSFE